MSREEDTVSRRGGDEFLYLLTELKDGASAATVAEKVVRTLAEPCDIGVDNVIRHHAVTASVGVAVFPDDGDTPEAMLLRADEAMYYAKLNHLGYSFAQ
jgi:diguanylate cyclase (GGDEF)-like protein